MLYIYFNIFSNINQVFNSYEKYISKKFSDLFHKVID